ncbi:basal body-orientation factor 1-like [Rhopilema esculentum]|uniref:basal body-orientation factor 1-like n=1 Tax=Rhopilema esculentum TaxID=499914 RepID=UPI0031DE7CD3
MPKKIKKQKSKSKGKTKGKKGSKASSKDDKESVLKNAVANARLWEGKLYSTERAKQEYRENAKKLLYENEGLQNQMAQIERDTVDVISFLKKEDMKKDDQVLLSNSIFAFFTLSNYSDKHHNREEFL